MPITMEIDVHVAEALRFMSESGVFDIDTGSVTLHFKDKRLLSIKRELFTYRKA
jgi:hypothetical protein